MSVASSKIVKDKGVSPNELEEEVAKAIVDIEAAPVIQLILYYTINT